MTLFTRQNLSAASAGIVLTLVAGGGAFLASSQASTMHHAGKHHVNATTLNGYKANQLTKVTSVQDPNPLDNFTTASCAFQTVTTLHVKNPHAGFLLVTATVGAARDTDFPSNEELVARVKLGTKVSGANATQLVTDGDYDGNVTVQATFPVKKGKSAVALQLSACQSTAAAYVDSRTVTALFVPFGSSTFVKETARTSSATNR